MSNRIRIIFHCDLEGPVAHVGHRALTVMQRLIKRSSSTPSKGEWIPMKEWVKRGKPFHTERLFDMGADGKVGYQYFVRTPATPQQAPVKFPEFPNLLEHVKWLWQHLPDDIRKHSQLIVTREDRRSRWARSVCNPARHGWGKPAKSGKNSIPKVGGNAHGLSYTWGLSELKAFDDLVYSSVFPTPAGGITATVPQAPTNGPVVTEGAPIPAPAQTASEYAAEMAAKIKAHSKQVQASVKQVHKVPYQAKPKLKYVPDFEDGPLSDEGPTTAGQHVAKPPAPKPKLRLGIWS